MQARDFEAYQEILRRHQAGAGASTAGEKYEAISKFLAGENPEP
jgi:hypothetical protein